jgi:hypothetical protein
MPGQRKQNVQATVMWVSVGGARTASSSAWQGPTTKGSVEKPDRVRSFSGTLRHMNIILKEMRSY